MTRSITLYPWYSEIEDGAVLDEENKRENPPNKMVRAKSLVKVFLLRVIAMERASNPNEW